MQSKTRAPGPALSSERGLDLGHQAGGDLVQQGRVLAFHHHPHQRFGARLANQQPTRAVKPRFGLGNGGAHAGGLHRGLTGGVTHIAQALRHGFELAGYYVVKHGPLNQVVHLWKYDSLADLEAKRASRDADPAWADYLARTEGMVQHQEDRIMAPAAFSPDAD